MQIINNIISKAKFSYDLLGIKPVFFPCYVFLLLLVIKDSYFYTSQSPPGSSS